MGATDGCAHATRSGSPDLRRGCACTRNLTEIAPAHCPRNKSCICPDSTGPVVLNGPRLHATTWRDARCWPFHHVLVSFACYVCPCARTRPPDRLRPPVVRKQVRRTQLEKGYLEGPGPARPLMGRTVSPEVNLDAKLRIPKSSAAAHNLLSMCCSSDLQRRFGQFGSRPRQTSHGLSSSPRTHSSTLAGTFLALFQFLHCISSRTADV